MPETGSGDRLHTDLVLDSNLASVDRGESLAMEAAQLLGFDADTQQDIGIAIRESLVNAVAHGNRYHARKKVRLRIWTSRAALTVEIEDEGRGFEPDAVPDPLEGGNVMKLSGRGLLMIRAYMDDFDYQRAGDSGTRVRLIKRVPQPADG